MSRSKGRQGIDGLDRSTGDKIREEKMKIQTIHIWDSETKRPWPLARYLMQRHLGRKLERHEYVHHKDGNNFNNDIDNLEVLSQSEHMKKHINTKEYIPWGDHESHVRAGQKSREGTRKIPPNINLAWCATCKEFLPVEFFGKNKAHWNGLCFECRSCHNKRRREYYARM